MPADLSARPARPAIRPVKKLLAANRSEIAVRIFRAATELGVHRTQLRRWIATLVIDPKTFT